MKEEWKEKRVDIMHADQERARERYWLRGRREAAGNAGESSDLRTKSCTPYHPELSAQHDLYCSGSETDVRRVCQVAVTLRPLSHSCDSRFVLFSTKQCQTTLKARCLIGLAATWGNPAQFGPSVCFSSVCARWTRVPKPSTAWIASAR